MFKKIKFDIAEGNVISTYENNNKSLDEVIKILSNQNVISITATRMTKGEYFKKYGKPIN